MKEVNLNDAPTEAAPRPIAFGTIAPGATYRAVPAVPATSTGPLATAANPPTVPAPLATVPPAATAAATAPIPETEAGMDVPVTQPQFLAWQDPTAWVDGRALGNVNLASQPRASQAQKSAEITRHGRTGGGLEMRKQPLGANMRMPLGMSPLITTGPTPRVAAKHNPSRTEAPRAQTMPARSDAPGAVTGTVPASAHRAVATDAYSLEDIMRAMNASRISRSLVPLTPSEVRNFMSQYRTADSTPMPTATVADTATLPVTAAATGAQPVTISEIVPAEEQSPQPPRVTALGKTPTPTVRHTAGATVTAAATGNVPAATAGNEAANVLAATAAAAVQPATVEGHEKRVKPKPKAGRGRSQERKQRRKPRSPSYHSSSSSSSSEDESEPEAMELDDSIETERPLVPSRRLRERVERLVDEARNRCFAIPDSLEEGQALQIQRLRQMQRLLRHQISEIQDTRVAGAEQLLRDLRSADSLVYDLVEGMLNTLPSTTASGSAYVKRPNKLPDKKFEGTGTQTWREYVRAELTNFFTLHRVAEKDRGVLAYMCLGTGPRSYIDSIKAAPINPAEHDKWLNTLLGGVDGLSVLTELLVTHPAYENLTGERGKLHALTNLRIKADASDLNAKFKQFTTLAEELKQTDCLTAKQRIGFLLDMVSPCEHLYSRIRRMHNHREWWDGVASDALPTRVALLESELFAVYKDMVQTRSEHRNLNHTSAATGAVDGERKRDSAKKRKRSSEDNRKKPRHDGAGPSGTGLKKSSKDKKSSGKKQRTGTLPPAVAQYRRENNLCFRCGSPAHVVADCPEPSDKPTNVDRDAAAAAKAAPKSDPTGKGKKGKGGKN